MKVTQQLDLAHEPIKHQSLIVRKQLVPVQSHYLILKSLLLNAKNYAVALVRVALFSLMMHTPCIA